MGTEPKTDTELAAEIQVIDKVSIPETRTAPEEGKAAELGATDEENTDGDDGVDTDDEEPKKGSTDTSEDTDGDSEEDDEDLDGEDDDEEDNEGLGLEELLGDTDDTDDEAADEDDPEPRKRNKVPAKKRIAELTAHRRAAEERAAAAEKRAEDTEARLAALEKKLTEEADSGKTNEGKSGDSPTPNPDDFTYGELDPEYIKAITKHAADEAKAEVRAEFENDRQAQAAQQTAEKLASKYVERVEAGKAAYDDYEAVVVDAANRGEYPLSETVVKLALDSDVGEKVLYDIASNKKLAVQLSEMSDTKQAQTFGRLEARHSANAAPKKPKKKVTKAPPPPKTRARGTGSKNSLDPKTASVTDLEKKWLADGHI